jgi:hypothetical protein
MIQMALLSLKKNSRGTDAILPSKAAILALGAISLGVNKVALVRWK